MMRNPYLVTVLDAPDIMPALGSCSTCHKVFVPNTSTNRNEVMRQLEILFSEHAGDVPAHTMNIEIT